jgi:hypothetical protein
MKSFVPLLGAGSTFAGATLLGLAAGVSLASRTGNAFWVLAGLFAGMALGAYGAYRLLARSL